MRRDHVASTLILRHFNVVCPLGCAIDDDSDQPAHPRSLTRVFTDRMYLLQPLGYPKTDKREPLPYWVNVQAYLCLGGHTDHALAHFKNDRLSVQTDRVILFYV